MTVAEWVLEEEQELKQKNPDISTKQIAFELAGAVLASYAEEMRRLGDLHWNERIDDKEFSRLKAEVRKNRDEDTAAVFAWWDWTQEGRPNG
jgi:hypothetical protein